MLDEETATVQEQGKFQTRGGEEDGELRFHKTLKDALEYAAHDKTVWKISFDVGEEQVRLAREGHRWMYTSPMENAKAEVGGLSKEEVDEAYYGMRIEPDMKVMSIGQAKARKAGVR